MADKKAFRFVRRLGFEARVPPEFRDAAADMWITPPQALSGFVGCTRRKEG